LLQGEMIAAGEHFERALALTTDPFVRARLQCQAASSLVTVGDQRGLDHLREALKVLDPETHPLETANALANEGRFHHLAGRHKKAIELLSRAAELVAPAAVAETVTTQEASIITMLYGYLAGAYQHSGLFSDGDVWARKSGEFGTAHNIPFAQALGLEYLGENAMNRGEFAAGLNYALREREIAERIHSRERRGWTHMCASLCAMYIDEERAEREFVEGIALGESIGELRLITLMKGNYAVFLAKRGGSFLDQALQLAQENFAQGETLGLLYTRAEGRRTLAQVRLARGEAAEAERLCAEALELVSSTESRVSRLWLGPVYIESLLAVGQDAVANGDTEKAKAKRARAAEHLTDYQQLVAECQSPLFKSEANRLSELVESDARASQWQSGQYRPR
jgi:tetratricopeptide (TPR) repeat protein